MFKRCLKVERFSEILKPNANYIEIQHFLWCVIIFLFNYCNRSSTPLAQNVVNWARAPWQDMWLSVSGVLTAKPIRSVGRHTNTDAPRHRNQVVEYVLQSFVTFAASNSQGHNIGVTERRYTTQRLWVINIFFFGNITSLNSHLVKRVQLLKYYCTLINIQYFVLFYRFEIYVHLKMIVQFISYWRHQVLFLLIWQF